MQDINPESHIDPVKVSAGDLSLNPYAHFELKRKPSAKKDVFENSERLADDSKVISGTDRLYLLCLFTICFFFLLVYLLVEIYKLYLLILIYSGINRSGVYKRPIARKRVNSIVNNLPPVYGTVAAPIRGNVTGMPTLSERKESREAVTRSPGVTLSSSAAIEGNSREAREKKMCDEVVQKDLPQSNASVDSPLAEPKQSMSSSMKKDADSEHSSPNCLVTENSGIHFSLS